MNNFDKLALEQNEKDKNVMFSSFYRISIIDLFEKMFYVRVNTKFKSFIMIFDL